MVDGGVGIETPDDPGRDDAGRDDDSPGFDIQARIFAIVGTFFTFIALVYGFLTYESAGTVMLSLASGLAFTIGAYLGWKKPPPHVIGGRGRAGRRGGAVVPGGQRVAVRARRGPRARGQRAAARALAAPARRRPAGLRPRRLHPAVEGPRLTDRGDSASKSVARTTAFYAETSVAGRRSVGRRRLRAVAFSTPRSGTARCGCGAAAAARMPLAMSRAWRSLQSR